MSPTIPPSEDTEGRPGVGRVEAFSDGVIAIIVTIMVLELHPPVAAGLDKLWSQWPVFFAYALSYLYVALYWSNHHRLFSHATVVSNGLIWSNMALLFALSLVPFSTAYLGEQHFSRDATLVYLVTMFVPAIAYAWLQRVIRATGVQGARASRYHVATLRKGIVAIILYLAGMPLSFISPWLGIGCAMLVAVLWFLPNSPFDRLFESRTGQPTP
ncbi:putative membrane protein [Sphingomonas sp. BE270]|uniref:TMEM175 family protein n=1 Tax=unclassified Sphingomonas TaxID=196159 RepID=UPI001E3DFD34|nr:MULTISPECIES: TMEM175 family protein [unclassified Sphingomonas]MDR6850081.1 putative membrane protein [Sphingomonas sp. BE137]MDR7257910.1 putative membrane protein [Sphingomonas sp. BE270]